MEKEKFIWNGIDLEELRQVMDKPADDAVTSIFESNSMDELRDILSKLAENDDFVSEQLPPAMHNFVQSELQFEFTPKDIELFRQTHEIWKKQGMRFVFILFFRALPYTYMAEKPANVLTTTKLLVTHTERRIFETAQFVFDVMDENWWEPDKRGILTALKVRIMHASMRHVILARKGEQKWNEEWGKPITQEDLVATNQVFSLEFFKGLQMLGDPLTEKEQKAWFHTWKTIGKIMGVQENLIPKNVDEGWKLQHTVYDHLFRDKTVAGIPLTKALVQTLHENFHLPMNLILYIMKQLLADEQFPDCFERMLGPTYKDEYPEFFKTYKNEKERKEDFAALRSGFKEHAQGYYQKIKENRPNLLVRFTKIRWVLDLIYHIMIFLGIGKNKLGLVDQHIDNLHKLIHKNGSEEPIDELEEGMILEVMSSLGGIMVGILSLHFRKGKDSGFRIPKTLKEHWSMH